MDKVCELQIDTRKLKKLIIKAVPYVAFSYVGNLIGFAYRTAEGNGFQEKILPFMSNLGVAFARILCDLSISNKSVSDVRTRYFLMVRRIVK